MTFTYRLVLCALLLAACSKKDGGGGAGASDDKVASCFSEMGGCREYRGDNLALGTESLEKLCTVVDTAAKFTMTACPTAKLTGTCAKPEGKDFYYEGYPIALAKLETSCKDGGGTFAKP